MKKTIKKFSLRSETVRSLANATLTGVFGGAGASARGSCSDLPPQPAGTICVPETHQCTVVCGTATCNPNCTIA